MRLALNTYDPRLMLETFPNRGKCIIISSKGVEVQQTNSYNSWFKSSRLTKGKEASSHYGSKGWRLFCLEGRKTI